MNMISLKSNMALNLRKMKKFFPHDYDFFPSTWVLPQEWF